MVNPLIARPQNHVGNALGWIADQNLAQQRNALVADRTAQDAQQFNMLRQDRQSALAAQDEEQQEAERAAMLYPRLLLGDPEAVATILQESGNPELQSMYGQLPPEQAAAGLAQVMESLYGFKRPESTASPQLSTQQVGGFEVLLEDGKRAAQRALPVRTQGGASVVGDGGGRPSLGKPPQGYRWTADNSLEPIPGGPAAASGKPALSPADANKARVKLTQIKIARNQLENAKAKYAALKDTISAGPGGAFVPSPKGQAFDKAIDSMRGSITALTRVPGVGAMSDFETRLDQAKFPTRNLYEEVGAQQLQALDDLIGALEQGYSEMLGGAAPESTAASPESDPLAAHEGKVITQGGKRYQVIRGANGKLFAQELK